MAESVVSPIVETLLRKLRSLDDNQNVLSEQGVDHSELEKIKNILSSIRAVFSDAEKQVKQKVYKDGVKELLRELKFACYDAEDVLDELEIESLHGQWKGHDQHGSIGKKVCHFTSCSKSPNLRFMKNNEEIREIRKRLDAIRVTMPKIEFKNRIHDNRTNRIKWEMTQSFVDASNVSERDTYKEDIINTLTQNHDVSVGIVTIVGDSGIGKTTLAKMVYGDKRIDSNFDKKLWVCIPQKFVMRKIIIDMIYFLCDEIYGHWEMGELQQKLRSMLEQRRYLLVLDDVMIDDEIKWNEFRSLLSVGEKGSRIILTTSSDEVASKVDTGTRFDLEWLSYKSCRSLFMRYAFEEGNVRNPELINIGAEIVKKCSGHPLIVRILAGALSFLTDKDDWKYVKDNFQGLEARKGEILPVLELCYNLLSPHLKQCFIYCSLFRKNHSFSSIILIQFWMAHGLLQSDDESEEPEFVGLCYINELRQRCFFQDFEENFGAISFKMHDLVYDLATKLAQNECLTSEPFRNKRTRSFFFMMQPGPSLLDLCIFHYPKVRALDLRNFGMEELPESIGSLKHLRYLNLTKSEKIRRLPRSILMLRSLETLLLAGCEKLEELPQDIGQLIKLRVLVFSSQQWCLPEGGIGCLTSLRTLGIGSTARWGLDDLPKDIGNLKALRTLIVGNCPRLLVSSLPSAVKNLSSLEKLMIFGCKKIRPYDLESDQAPKSLKPSLRMLCIDRVAAEELPQWLLQLSAKTLRSLAIKNCPYFERLPAEWTQILQSLEVLEITNCPEFSSLPEDFRFLTALRELKIRGCPELSRRCRGEDRPEISHIPKVELDEDDNRIGYEPRDDNRTRRSVAEIVNYFRADIIARAKQIPKVLERWLY